MLNTGSATKYTRLQLTVSSPGSATNHNREQRQPQEHPSPKLAASAGCHQTRVAASGRAYTRLVDDRCHRAATLDKHLNTQPSNITHHNNTNTSSQAGTALVSGRRAANQEPPSRHSAHHCQCYCYTTARQATTSLKFNRPYPRGVLINMRPADIWDRYANIRWFGIVFFVLASCFCIYKVFQTADDESARDKLLYHHELKLVNVFGRHGDRAPSDGFPPGDPTAKKVDSFWPNGASNLVEMGKSRQFKIGLELQHRYAGFLDFQASNYLAFSSPIYRCQESLQYILRGLFENEWSLNEGLHFIEQLQSNCAAKSSSSQDTKNATTNNSTNYTDCQWASKLPSGSGEPREWQKIPIDINTVPALTYDYLNNCSYRLSHPTKVDLDLFNSPSIAKLSGARELAKVLKSRYNQPFDYDAMVLWSTIAGEIRLVKTRETLTYGMHYFDWVLTRLPELFGPDSNITLFDVYEQVSVLAYRERLDGKEINQIQLSPLLGSLVQSQLVALDRAEPPQFWFLKPNELYHKKKLILYSSHDSILQLLMYRLNMIRSYEDEGKSFKWRLEHCASMSKKKSDLDFNCYLTGVKMASYGMSVAFELWDVKALKEFDASKVNGTATGESKGAKVVETNGKQYVEVKSMPYVRALLYYEEDARFRRVEYKMLSFGTMCRDWFTKTYPTESIDRFYDQEFKIDRQTSCPFELFRNMTSEYLTGPKLLKEWCGTY